MCMWVSDVARINLRELRPFELSDFRHFLHSRVWRLEFSMYLFETLHTCCGHNENMYVEF